MDDNERKLIARLNSALPKERRRPLPAPEGATDTLQTLAALSPRSYADKVTGSLGREHDHLWELFLHDNLIRYTHSALVRKQARVRRLLTMDGGVTDGRTAYLRLVEERLHQVEAHSGLARVQRNTIVQLTGAIRRHQFAISDAGVLPEAWDQELWNVLKEIDGRAKPAEPA